MLHFDTFTGLTADDVTAVREAVAAEWIEAFKRNDSLPELNTAAETPAGQLIDSQTAHIVEKDSELLFLANQFNPLTAEGVWQDALGKIYFLTRKTAQYSEASCICSGLEGTVIAKNAVIRSSADSTLWLCTSSVTIDETGTATARFVAETAGALSAAADTLTEIVTVTPGWDGVTNPAAAVVGRVVETQAEFESRRYSSVVKNARGSCSAIYGAIADLEDVISLVILENISDSEITEWGVTVPAHSIYLSVLGGGDDEIAEALYRKKAAGCGTAGNTTVTYTPADLAAAPLYTYYIERPEPLPMGVRVTMVKTDRTPEDIEDLVRAAIIENFNGDGEHGYTRVKMAMVLYASRFYCSAVEAGVEGLVSIEICAPAEGANWTDSVTINADQSPVLDEADITIVYQDGE